MSVLIMWPQPVIAFLAVRNENNTSSTVCRKRLNENEYLNITKDVFNQFQIHLHQKHVYFLQRCVQNQLSTSLIL